MLARFGVEVRRYDLRDPDGFRRACEGATLAIIETPSNPLLQVTDIAEYAAAAHAGGALLCCDNTFATPLLQRPLDLGADLAWQSATKYLARALRPARRRRHDARRALPSGCWVRRTVGGVLAPGSRPGCCCAACARCTSACRARSRRRPSWPGASLRTRTCSAVHYPGLPDHPEHELARRQMPGGAGGVLAFELADGVIAGHCEEAVRLVRNATSLGGVETLIERRARIEPEGRVAEGLLRLAVGLERVDRSSGADLRQAMVRPARGSASGPGGTSTRHPRNRAPSRQTSAGTSGRRLEGHERIVLDAESELAGHTQRLRVADPQRPARRPLGHDRDLETEARRLAEPALGLGHADAGGRSARSRRTRTRARARRRARAEAIASATPRSAAGSSTRTPPATLTKTSCCRAPTPPCRASTASSSARRLRSKPLASRARHASWRAQPAPARRA